MANFEFLRKVPLFAEMSDSDLESMCLIVQELHLRAGEVLFVVGVDRPLAGAERAARDRRVED